MGLDCFLIARNEDGDVYTFQNPIPGHTNTWRKYYTLHNWVQERWIKKGNSSKDTDFNCVEVKITTKRLEKFFRSEDADFDTPNDVDYENLPDDDDDLTDAEFYRNWNRTLLEDAKDYEDDGYTLYYYSWF